MTARSVAVEVGNRELQPGSERLRAGLPVSVSDFHLAARGVLPAGVSDFVDGGAETELTLARNRTALDALELVPRVFADVTEVK